MVVSPGPVVPHDMVPPAPSHLAAWLVGAGGIASLGVGTYFGARALAERSMSDATCAGAACSAAGLGAYDSARSDARAADVAIGIGVVALGVGTFLLFSSGSDARHATALHVTAGGLRVVW